MLIRLYENLLVRLMPNSLLDAMYDAHEAYLENLASISGDLEIIDAAHDTLRHWLDVAESTGWLPFYDRLLAHIAGNLPDADQ